MRRISIGLCVLLLWGSACAATSTNGRGDASEKSPGRGRLARAARSTYRGVHEVHLRTGVVDVDAEHSRLPAPTPLARRLLAQRASVHVPTSSPEWGPLSDSQLWLLTLGPDLHYHEAAHGPTEAHGGPESDPEPVPDTDADPQPAQPRTQTGPGRAQPLDSLPASEADDDATGDPFLAADDAGSFDASLFLGQGERERELPQFAADQDLLLARLRAEGVAVVSFLPPAAWLLAVSADADLAGVLSEYPGLRAAPYGPPHRRIAPELHSVLHLLKEARQAAAEALAGGGRLDELLAAAGGAEAATVVLGAMRRHAAPRAPASTSSAPGNASSASSASPAGPTRVVLEVSFPHLEHEDLATLAGLTLPHPSAPNSGSESTPGQRASEAQAQAQAQAPGQDDGAAGRGREAGAGDGGVVLPPYRPAHAAAADWAEALAALSPRACPPLLAPDRDSPTVLTVAVCPEALEATAEWLAAAPQVSWLAPRMAARVHNLLASAVIQTGGYPDAPAQAQLLSMHPFWAAGLDGRNQTVGCGDSGLDVGNCYFYDPAVPFMQNVQTDANGMQYFLSTRHRKLRYYLAVVQDLYDSFGHGTHVSGTLVGSRFDRPSGTSEPLDPATGQAPAAKIAFMDLSRDKGDGVWTPGDLARSYFNLTYSVGARVHSDSWGSDLTAYDSMASALDRFTWANQDFLSVFAAGNYGATTTATTTVTSPAVAKNCLTAGATLASTTSGDKPSAYGVTVFSMTVTMNMAGGQGGSRTVRVVGAGFGGDLGTIASAGLVAATPADACSGISNAGGIRGRVVLIQRGRCYFTDKMKAAATAGAVGVVVYNDRQDGYFQMLSADGASATPAVPMGSVPLSTGRWLLAAVGSGSVSVSFRRAPDTAPAGYEDVATYSSFGPTTDGRIKPEITAPGSLLSAASSGTLQPDGATPTCNSAAYKSLHGTSMATPAIAGSALLVRQYFTDGFYPDGRATPGAGFSPSGALIKAVLLGGAQHMDGSVSGTGMPLEDVPSYRQGFGRASLLHSLPLPTVAAAMNPGWRLQVVDGASLAQGELHRFCVRSTGSGPLRITLVWFDWPGDPSASRVLVNNLDLQVRAAGRAGLVDYGNGVIDSVNTVEQVWYDSLPAGDVSITVSAPTVFSRAGRQPYALAVHGRFSGTLRAPTPGSGNVSAPACVVQLAVIDDNMSSPILTNRRDVTFYFSTSDLSATASGFECRLAPETSTTSTRGAPTDSTDSTTSDGGGVGFFASSPPPSRASNSSSNSTGAGAWLPCVSPTTYTALQDGRYSFQVRVKNEEVAAIRPLTVDATPPVTTLTSSLQPAANATSITTSSDNATFYFVASDTSTSVNFTCFIAFSNGPPGQDAPPRIRRSVYLGEGGTAFVPVAVQQWFACSSPLELAGLSFGDYEMQVLAYDAAKNAETQNKQVTWKTRYQPNTPYARLASGPVGGVIANDSLDYTVTLFVGAPDPNQPPLERVLAAADGTAASTDYQSTVVLVPAGVPASVTSLTAATTWTALGSSSLNVRVPTDGQYLVAVRPTGSTDASTWAVASVTVDTTPPIVNVTRKPGATQSDPRVTIAFGDGGSEGDVRAFFCRWMGPASSAPDPDTPDAPPNAFAPCAGTSTHDNVTEGFWLFQVKGRDAAGNMGDPTAVPFRTDLSPPVITALVPPAATASRLAWNFTVDDGPSGTGVANVSCSLRWTFLVDITNVSVGDAQFPPGSPSARWVTPCPNPARYTVQEGSYLWSIAAADGAGLRASADFPIVIDRTPPISRIFTPPLAAGRMLPPRVSFSFASTDKPDASPSGLSQQQCLLTAVSAPPPASPPPAPPAPLPAPSPPLANVTGSAKTAAVPLLTPGGASRRAARSLLQQVIGLRISNGSAVQLSSWHVCDANGTATNVTYDGFSSGYYTFQVRAMDRAGNVGDPTQAYFFAVDDTLPPDGSTTIEVGQPSGGSSGSTRTIVIAVLVAVGAIVIVAATVGIVYARRRHLRKRYNAPPAVHVGNGISMQPMGSVGYSNGHSNGHLNGQNSMRNLSHGGGGAGSRNARGNSSAALGSPNPSLPLPPSSSGGVVPMPYATMSYGPAVGVPTDPALAAALAASAAEAERSRVEAAEEERVRRAIAASIEEENLRRAMQASLAVAAKESAARSAADAEAAAMDAAIAASLASAQQQAQRQASALRGQMAAAAQAPPPTPRDASGQPSAPPAPRPPSESLI
ncbi:hypothetical protein HYH03_003413 [Edaphochlamys debaryana]|uniref:Uncharacterized protein n=1 Tax=Edaphochlamys debaryana TaxID=47281 RepID=A0A835YCC5_9CHLO|nr:hypothetical protein HYH03_003413 [Edaphochlamys debaryana]|eukprot:KAG2498668.1 hypothetical protein HYH03_003413 [Edaphochlamys debaryana]